MSENILITMQGNVAHLELNRSKQHNALDRDLAQGFSDAIDTIVDTEGVRAVAITARGTSFCVGGDLGYFVERFEHLAEEFDSMVLLWQQAMQKLAAIAVPVVVGAQGGVGGGGMGILWAGDHVIAADSMKMATGFASIGVSGDGGNTWYLPRMVGMRRAKEMMMEAKTVDADMALDWGLVNNVVPEEQLVEAVLAKAQKFSTGSITAMAAIKRLLSQSSSSSLEEQLNSEWQEMVVCANKNDIKIGMQSFLKRQKPQFSDQ